MTHAVALSFNKWEKSCFGGSLFQLLQCPLLPVLGIEKLCEFLTAVLDTNYTPDTRYLLLTTVWSWSYIDEHPAASKDIIDCLLFSPPFDVHTVIRFLLLNLELASSWVKIEHLLMVKCALSRAIFDTTTMLAPQILERVETKWITLQKNSCT